MLGKPTRGAVVTLKRVARYMKGTRDLVHKLEVDKDLDKHVVRLQGFSDSDSGGCIDRKSQSSGSLFVDGARRVSEWPSSTRAVPRPTRCCWHGRVLSLHSRGDVPHGQRGCTEDLQM